MYLDLYTASITVLCLVCLITTCIQHIGETVCELSCSNTTGTTLFKVLQHGFCSLFHGTSLPLQSSLSPMDMSFLLFFFIIFWHFGTNRYLFTNLTSCRQIEHQCHWCITKLYCIYSKLENSCTGHWLYGYICSNSMKFWDPKSSMLRPTAEIMYVSPVLHKFSHLTWPT